MYSVCLLRRNRKLCIQQEQIVLYHWCAARGGTAWESGRCVGTGARWLATAASQRSSCQRICFGVELELRVASRVHTAQRAIQTGAQFVGKGWDG